MKRSEQQMTPGIRAGPASSARLGEGTGSIVRASDGGTWLSRPGAKVTRRALGDCVSAFERFLKDAPEATPPFRKAALAHLQNHRFLDRNGRMGRRLAIVSTRPMLCSNKSLEHLVGLEIVRVPHARVASV
jgi:hypothetical protein